MADRPSGRIDRQVHRLFHFGAVGTVSDAQLLDWFVSRRDDAAEAAFEELVIRHGPMVIRVCGSRLQNAHDAEDAFQAVFLVLAQRAGAIRRRGSVASWLFGVAQRVATRVKRSAARRHALDQVVAERTSESYLSAENDSGWEILHDEINDLPEPLRAPLVLCYLQGLTYEEAAHQLGLTAVAIRGRLARARERLRRRLTRREVTVPAGLLGAGAVGQAQAAVPVTLIHSTTRMALGFTAGDTAVVLARGVLNSMLSNQLKVAALFLCLGIGSSYWAWHVFASAVDEKAQPNPGPGVARTPASAPKSQTTQPAVTFGLTGSVRLEGTGEPVAGATVEVMIGDSSQGHRGASRTARSGADGRFAVDLPPGSARAWTLLAPVGYWAPENHKNIEEFAVSQGEPVHRKDYVIRRGTVWDFRIRRADEAKPIPGIAVASGGGTSFRSTTDDAGRVHLTLPTEGGKVMAGVGARPEPADLVPVTLEWESGFRPDAVQSVTNLGGSPASYRLVDDRGKTATVSGTNEGRAEPRVDDRKLVVEVTLPVRDPRKFGALSGKVVDGSGRPIVGVRVALIWVEEHGGSGMSGDDRHTVMTDTDGSFLIPSINRTRPDGKSVRVRLAVTKEGFAGVDTQPVRFQPPSADGPQLAAPVTLAPGVSVSGTVVDPDGKPLAGVWVEPGGSYASRSRFTKTDDAGRFTVRDLPAGVVPLSFHYGKLMAGGKYLALRDADPLTIKLGPLPDAAQVKARAETARAAIPKPPAVGTPAPEWNLSAWSDGRSRSLADYRGKVVFLDFWGLWCGACVNAMPSLERLKQTYEPRGVVFLSIHTPGEEIGKIRRFLDFKKAGLISALDVDPGQRGASYNGVTADRYGVRGYPTFVIIDRRGAVAFHSGIGTAEGVAAMKALGEEMGLKESTMTEADFSRLFEVYFGREVDKVLHRP